MIYFSVNHEEITEDYELKLHPLILLNTSDSVIKVSNSKYNSPNCLMQHNKPRYFT